MTELYHRIIEHAKNKPIKSVEESLALAHKIWDPTPWVIDVYIGERDERGIGEDENDMMRWCTDNFGKESWPIHDKPADWYRGGATVNGWTWFGFKTKEMMAKFMEAWPDNVNKIKPLSV